MCFHLVRRGTAFPQSDRVVFGFDVADDRSDSEAIDQPGHRVLQQLGFARTGRGNEIRHENPVGGETGSQPLRKLVILLENVFANLNQLGGIHLQISPQRGSPVHVLHLLP